MPFHVKSSKSSPSTSGAAGFDCKYIHTVYLVVEMLHYKFFLGLSLTSVTFHVFSSKKKKPYWREFKSDKTTENIAGLNSFFALSN